MLSFCIFLIFNNFIKQILYFICILGTVQIDFQHLLANVVSVPSSVIAEFIQPVVIENTHQVILFSEPGLAACGTINRLSVTFRCVKIGHVTAVWTSKCSHNSHFSDVSTLFFVFST